MSFAEPLWLCLLMIPLVLWWLESRFHQRRAAPLERFGQLHLVQSMLSENSWGLRAKRALFYLGMLCLLLVLARPQWGFKEESFKSRGLEVIFAVDLSRSMLAEDVIPNRLEKTVLEMGRMIDALGLNRLGLVTFEGSASPLVPLTADHSAIKLFMNTLKVHREPLPGTSLAAAFECAEKMFSKNTAYDKALIIFTDGEDHEGGLGHWRERAENQKIHVYPVGIGTEAGQPIPVYQDGKAAGYKKDRQGKLVISHMNLEALKTLSTENKIYLINEKGGSALAVMQDLENLKKGTFQNRRLASKIDRYSLFALLALVLISLETCLSHASQPRDWKKNLSRMEAFSKKSAAVEAHTVAALIVLTLCFSRILAGTVYAGPIDDLRLRKGNQYLEKGNLRRAYKYYERLPEDEATTHLSRGLALEKSNEHGAAANAFAQALKHMEPGNPLRSDAFYNLGSSLAGTKQFPEALKALEQSLLLKPNDPDTKHNLEVVRRLMVEQKQQKPQPQNQEHKENKQQSQAKSILDSFKDQEKKDLEERMRQQQKEKHVEKDW